VGLICLLIGTGLGLIAGPTLIAAQAAVPWEQRGLVTSAQSFSRAIGGALGVAVFGAIANATLGHASPGPRQVRVEAFTTAVHHVFLATVACAVLVLIAVGLMPGGALTHLERGSKLHTNRLD
jgi:hypothetical protein